MIVRTILPIISSDATGPGNGPHLGVGDITQSFFFAPPPMAGGIIFAAGPVFVWPIGGAALGSGKWSAGPTFVLLKQSGPTTVGILANQVWSYAGDGHHPDVSSMLLQPFFTYTYSRDTTGLSLNTEASYDWIHRQWTVPVDVGVNHIFKFGRQPVQLGATAKLPRRIPKPRRPAQGRVPLHRDVPVSEVTPSPSTSGPCPVGRAPLVSPGLLRVRLGSKPNPPYRPAAKLGTKSGVFVV